MKIEDKHKTQFYTVNYAVNIVKFKIEDKNKMSKLARGSLNSCVPFVCGTTVY